jgi:F-type H+-transporting ATPase subunit a
MPGACGFLLMVFKSFFIYSTLIFAANFRHGMLKERFKCLLVAVFSVFAMGLANTAIAQHEVEENTNNDEHYEAEDETGGEHSGKFDANEVIFGHVMDAHQYHFFTLGDFHATLPLPVILYEPGRGWKVFSSSRFHHGEDAYEGYRLVTAHYKEQLKKDGMKDTDIQLLSDESIIAVDEKTGRPLTEVAVYDFSLTRNVEETWSRCSWPWPSWFGYYYPLPKNTRKVMVLPLLPKVHKT